MMLGRVSLHGVGLVRVKLGLDERTEGEGLPCSRGGSQKGLQHIEVLELELSDEDGRVVHPRGSQGRAEGRARYEGRHSSCYDAGEAFLDTEI